MSDNIFQLANIIKAAGSDPSDIATAIWSAHYRKPERNDHEVTCLSMDIICNYCLDSVPAEHWPENLDGLLKFELGVLVDEFYSMNPLPGKIAKAVLAVGYRLDEITAEREATERDIAVDEMHVMYVNAPDTTSVRQYLEMLYDAGYRKVGTNG